MNSQWKLICALVTVLSLSHQIQCHEIVYKHMAPASLSSSSEENQSGDIFDTKEGKNNTDLDFQQTRISSEYNTSTTEKSSEPSKTAMDIITIVWYTSTFLALAAFFFLMACSDRRCGRRFDQSRTSNRNRLDSIECPPSPAPSYRAFAPPSYESVMSNGIYVIPINDSIKEAPLKDKFCDQNGTPNAPELPKITYINEQSKTG